MTLPFFRIKRTVAVERKLRWNTRNKIAGVWVNEVKPILQVDAKNSIISIPVGAVRDPSRITGTKRPSEKRPW